MANHKSYEYGLIIEGVHGLELHALRSEDSGSLEPLKSSKHVGDEYGCYGDLFLETPPFSLEKVFVSFASLRNPLDDLPIAPDFTEAVIQEVLSYFPNALVKYGKFETER